MERDHVADHGRLLSSFAEFQYNFLLGRRLLNCGGHVMCYVVLQIIIDLFRTAGRTKEPLGGGLRTTRTLLLPMAADTRAADGLHYH